MKKIGSPIRGDKTALHLTGGKTGFSKFVQCFQGIPQRKRGGEGGSGAQKRGPALSPDAVGANKKTSTPRTSDRSHKTKTTNLNLAQHNSLAVFSL